MRETQTRTFFGDGEHDFCLTPEMITELERVTDRGIGSIFTRLGQGEFAFVDVVEVIRLGLIGGGMAPKRAMEMVDAYVRPRPLGETRDIALLVVLALWLGRAPDAATEGVISSDALAAAATGDLAAAITAAVAEVRADD